MDTLQRTIRPDGSTIAGRARIALVVAVLIVGLLAGFGLGRAGGRSGVAPAWSLQPAYGPGHVPRVWVHQP